MHRQANGAALVGNGACDGLANPPSGVGGELVALFVVELLGCTNQAKASFLNQVLEAQASIHVLLGNRDHQAQVGLHHLFLGPAAQHQAPAEADERHFHQGCPLFVVGFPAVIAFKLSSQFLEIEKIGNFAGQFDLFVGTQQADPPDFLQINPDGVFGVNAFGADLDAGQGFGLGFLLSSCGFGFSLQRLVSLLLLWLLMLSLLMLWWRSSWRWLLSFVVVAFFVVVLALVLFAAAFLVVPEALA